MANSRISVNATPYTDLTAEGLESGVQLVVVLHSNKKPNFQHQAEKRIARNTPLKELIQTAGYMAGALAEKQNLQYGDDHTPEQCAKLAEKITGTMIDKATRAGRDVQQSDDLTEVGET